MTPETPLFETARRAADRARDTWSKVANNWLAWRERSSGEREEVHVTELSAPEPVRRWRAAAALRRNPLCGPDAVSALVRALGDEEQFVRWHAAEALAAQEPGRAHQALERALTDPDPVRRAGAAEALGKLGGESATLALKKRIADPEASVRQAVAAALGEIADPTTAESLLPLIEDDDPQVVRAAARALGQVGNTLAACSLAATLVRPGQDLLVRRALAAALAHIPHPDAQAPLLEALSDPDPQVRAYAASALGQVGNEEAHEPLAALTGDKSRLIRGTVSDRAKRAVELLERRGRRQAQQA
jgi:HEAT repeat protein